MRKRKVWPVDGLFIQGVPHVAHDCDDAFCTESGAFTTTPPPVEVADPQPEAPTADPGAPQTED